MHFVDSKMPSLIKSTMISCAIKNVISFFLTFFKYQLVLRCYRLLDAEPQKYQNICCESLTWINNISSFYFACCFMMLWVWREWMYLGGIAVSSTWTFGFRAQLRKKLTPAVHMQFIVFTFSSIFFPQISF